MNRWKTALFTLMLLVLFFSFPKKVFADDSVADYFMQKKGMVWADDNYIYTVACISYHKKGYLKTAINMAVSAICSFMIMNDYEPLDYDSILSSSEIFCLYDHKKQNFYLIMRLPIYECAMA